MPKKPEPVVMTANCFQCGAQSSFYYPTKQGPIGWFHREVTEEDTYEGLDYELHSTTYTIDEYACSPECAMTIWTKQA